MNEIKTNINWFPGHMAKAKREISECLKLVDLVIELIDARIPYSSTNPMIKDIIGNKPRLVLLNKSNLADKTITRDWINYYKENNIIALDIDSISNYNINKIYEYSKLALKEVFEKRKNKGIRNETIKAIILGIPNVGKSTLINNLGKRKSLKTGDKPGVTKTQTWLKVNDNFLLLDTPGILWPKFESEEVGINLSICGSIKDDILDLEYIANKAISYIINNYPNLLKNRYNIEETNPSNSILEQIALKRGLLLKGGLPDVSRSTIVFLNELRGNKIGAISYEKPDCIRLSI